MQVASYQVGFRRTGLYALHHDSGECLDDGVIGDVTIEPKHLGHHGVVGGHAGYAGENGACG